MRRVHYLVLLLFVGACYLHADEPDKELGTVVIKAPARFTVGDSDPTSDRELAIGRISETDTWTFLTLPVPPFRIHILWARTIGHGSNQRQILRPPVELMPNGDYSFTIRRYQSKLGINRFQLMKITQGRTVLLDQPLHSTRWVAVQKVTE